MQKISRRSALKRTVAAAGVPFIVGSSAPPTQAGPLIYPSRKKIHTDLYNFHLRAPRWWPETWWANDLMIIVYGHFPNGARDVIKTYVPPAGSLPWNPEPVAVDPPTNWPWNTLDPRHRGANVDPLYIRYLGPDIRWPTWIHVGIHFRPCRFHVHIEAWWTFNGRPIWRACVVHIHKIRLLGRWLVRVVHPRVWRVIDELPDQSQDLLVYPYGLRYFIPSPSSTRPLPKLEELMPAIMPGDWDDEWHYPPDQLGGLGLEPDAETTIPLANDADAAKSPVFQIALREKPLEPGQVIANPLDDDDTIFVGTDRAADENEADLNGDGLVDYDDYLKMRQNWNAQSQDLVP